MNAGFRSRRSVVVVSCVLALAAGNAAAQAKKDPKEEFQARWTALAKRVAQVHLALGKKFTEKKMHELAWEEWRRAVALDATNADAQRALGRRLDKAKGEWLDASPPAAPKKNEGKESEVKIREKECAEERAAACAKAVAELESLAIWAENNALKDEAKGIWERILRDYDPKSERAMKGTGWEQRGGHWLSPEDVAKLDAGKKKVDTSTDGAAVTEPSDIEKILSWSLVKRRGPHSFLEGAYTDDEMKALIRITEATRLQIVEALNLGPNALAKPMHGVLLKTEAPYQEFVERASGIDAADRPIYKQLDGYVHRGRMEFIHVQGKYEFPEVKDETSHLASHLLLHQITGLGFDPPWLQEGVAYWVTGRLLQTAYTRCVPPETSASGVREMIDALDWKRDMKSRVEAGTAPQFRDVMLSTMTTLNMSKQLKSWSVVEFLIAEHRDEFLSFLRGMKTAQKQEEALLKAMNVKTTVDFDALWTAYVKEKY